MAPKLKKPCRRFLSNFEKGDFILKFFLVFIFNILFAYSNSGALAAAIHWSIDEGSKIDIRAKYTFGTHELTTDNISGTITELKGQYSGDFAVPISSIKEGNPKLECHLQEALGLNYEKSDYPNKHICTDDHKIPSEGLNSISYPDIRFKIEDLRKAEDRFFVTGQWTIHGVSKTEKMEILFKEIDSELIKLNGKIKFNLKDYGVTVKKAFIISVNDEVEVSIDLNLRQRR